MGIYILSVCTGIGFIALGAVCIVSGARLRRLTDTVSKIGAQTAQTRREMQEAQEKLNERLLRLEQGAVPNYEAQKKAKEEVDAFNIGIANILGYNQRDALKRKEETSE